ncbi:MAG: MMPL family transporter [Methylococcales bacterium]|nr:MMPL family transporter [Methylococcales bacterium]
MPTTAKSLVKNRIIAFLTHPALRWPWWIVACYLLLSLGSAYISATRLGINTDTVALINQDLPFLQARNQLDAAFPQDASPIIIVAESDIPEQALFAVRQLHHAIEQHPELFASGYIPDDQPFLRQQGLLYLSPPELEHLSTRLTDAQPFIGYLSQHFHVAGLVSIIEQAFAHDIKLDTTTALPPLLKALQQTLAAAADQQSRPVSWQRLLTPDTLGDAPNRRLLLARPKQDFSELLSAEQPMLFLSAQARRLEAEQPGLRIGLTGEVALEYEEMQSLNATMTYASIMSMIMVCLILWLGLRSWALLLASMISLVSGLLLTAGFATLAIGHLNLISIAFAVLYIGLGVDFATHYCLRYRESLLVHQHDAGAALMNSSTSLGCSLGLCALTSAMGFFAFVPTDFKGVSELGIISGVGMFIGLLVSLNLLPALLKLLPKPRPIQPLRLPESLYLLPFRYRTVIRSLAVILVLGAGVSLAHVRFDASPVNLRDPNTESVQVFKKLLTASTDSPFVVSALAANLQQAEQLAEQFTRLDSVHEALTLHNWLPEQQDDKLELLDTLNMIIPGGFSNFPKQPQSSDVRGALIKLSYLLEQHGQMLDPSLTDALQQQIYRLLGQAPAEAIYRQIEHDLLAWLPDTLHNLADSLKAQPVSLDTLPASFRQHWVSADGQYRVLIFPEQDLNNPAHLRTFATEVMSVDERVFGLPIGDMMTAQAVVNAFIQAFASALVMIVVLLGIVTGSLRKTLLMTLPLLLAAMTTAAINVWLDNPFNFANVIVLPLLLGIGIDSTIHMVDRAEQPGQRLSKLLKSSTARGILFSALTTLTSFSSLAFTGHAGIASMGLLLTIGIATTLFITLVVLPAWLASGKTLADF